MRIINIALVLILSTCGSCDVELDKCSLYNETCQLDFFQNIGTDLSFTGIPDLGIPVIDPFALADIHTSILGHLNLTLVEGEAVGIQKCLVSKYITNVPERYKEPEMTCSKMVIRGRYKLTSTPLVKKYFGDIHGDAFLKITVDNWYLKFRYPFSFVRRGAEGTIYLNAIFDKAIYETRVDKVTVEICGLKMGVFDISNAVSTLFNEHWKLAMASNFGKMFYDKSAQYYYDIYKIFFDTVPASEYLTDNLDDLVTPS